MDIPFFVYYRMSSIHTEAELSIDEVDKASSAAIQLDNSVIEAAEIDTPTVTVTAE